MSPVVIGGDGLPIPLTALRRVWCQSARGEPREAAQPLHSGATHGTPADPLLLSAVGRGSARQAAQLRKRTVLHPDGACGCRRRRQLCKTPPFA